MIRKEDLLGRIVALETSVKYLKKKDIVVHLPYIGNDPHYFDIKDIVVGLVEYLGVELKYKKRRFSGIVFNEKEE